MPEIYYTALFWNELEMMGERNGPRFAACQDNTDNAHEKSTVLLELESESDFL